MSFSAYQLASTKKTSEPRLVDVLQAQKINRLLGTSLLPWELRLLPEDEIEAILALEQVGEYRQGLGKVENIFEKWRQEHGGK